MRGQINILVLIVALVSGCDSSSDITHDVDVSTNSKSYSAGDAINVKITNGLSIDLSLKTFGRGRDYVHEVVTIGPDQRSIYGQVVSLEGDSILAQGESARYTIDSGRFADRVESLPDTFMVRFMRTPGEIPQYRQLPWYFFSDPFVIHPQ